MIKSNYNFDVYQSQLLEKIFLDCTKDYLERVSSDCKMYHVAFDTLENKQLQYLGADVIGVRKTARPLLFDIKWQTNGYFNNPTNSFVFETLANIRDKENTPGWGISGLKKTDYYIFVYPHSVKVSYENRKKIVKSKEDVFMFDFMIVPTHSLSNYIFSHGLTAEEIYDISVMLKTNVTYINGVRVWDNTDRKSKSVTINGLRFVWSYGFAENPVNIVISKTDYETKIAGTRDFLYCAGEIHEVKPFIQTGNANTWQRALPLFKSCEARQMIEEKATVRYAKYTRCA